MRARLNVRGQRSLGMKTVLIVPKTPDPFREAWEQTAVEAGHIHHITADLTGFLQPLGRCDERKN